MSYMDRCLLSKCFGFLRSCFYLVYVFIFVIPGFRVEAKPWHDPGEPIDVKTRIIEAMSSSNAFLVLSGGYGSCFSSPSEIGTFPLMQNLRDSLEKEGKSLHYVATCHAHVDRSIIVSDSENPGISHTMDLEQGLEHILDVSSRAPDAKIHFIGHSWGAWVNMKLAQNLSDKKKLGAFITMDPISKKLCTLEQFLWIYAGLSSSTDCQRSPFDISEYEKERITTNADFWFNYYQDTSKVLHSSEISHSQENLKMSYPEDYVDLGQAHRHVDNDLRVWLHFVGDLIRVF